VRSLYLKIFLWFWAAMTLLVVSVMWTTHQVADLAGLAPETSAELRQAVRELRAALAGGGEARAREVLARLDPGARSRLRVFGPGGELLGRAPDPAAARRLFVEELRSSAGDRYRIAVTLREPGRREHGPPGRDSAHPRAALGWLLGGPAPIQWTRLAVAVAVSGFVCFLLARYLSAPVGRLRNAAQRLAAGDLATRVGPAFGARRDEIGELGRDFDAMAERLEALLGAQTRLIRDVSHELRSPLARLQVALELARKRAGAAASAELDRIEREAERLNELIGRILALERLERNLVDERAARVDLLGLVRSVVADADYEARAQGRSVALVEGAALFALGREDLLRSAVENVVRNAVRYTTGGDRIEVRLASAGAESAIRVRDHGPGVPERALASLFEPFFRAESARDRASGGSGLGLAITERTVRNHGGRVAARNAPGGGLEVELRLPAYERAGGRALR